MIILDSGPLVALLNSKDTYHDWAKSIFATLSPPFWTNEAVITEAAHLTGQPHMLCKKIEMGVLQIGLDAQEQAGALKNLLVRYAPRMDYADACVVRMTELYNTCKVLTLDRRDFTIYRRNRRHVIPLIAPNARD